MGLLGFVEEQGALAGLFADRAQEPHVSPSLAPRSNSPSDSCVWYSDMSKRNRRPGPKTCWVVTRTTSVLPTPVGPSRSEGSAGAGGMAKPEFAALHH
jgi:hypothetical protein